MQARIERRAIGVALFGSTGGNPGRNPDSDFAPGCKTWVEHTQGGELVSSAPVDIEVLGLAKHGLLPFQPEPSQVVEDGAFKIRACARLVDILDANEKAATGAAGPVMANDRRQRVTQMQLTIWARRKAEDRLQTAFIPVRFHRVPVPLRLA